MLLPATNAFLFGVAFSDYLVNELYCINFNLFGEVIILIYDLVKIFEKTSNRFLKEQKAFILSDVSERSMCGELMKYLTNEIQGTPFSTSSQIVSDISFFPKVDGIDKRKP